jgi:hypothetical protein
MTLSRLIDNATKSKPVSAAEELATAVKAAVQLSGLYASTDGSLIPDRQAV